jgi:hypothetical protein
VVKPFTYGTVLYDGKTNTFEGYDPEVHILLTVSKSRNVDTRGAEAELPRSLEGISGSSLWQAYYQGLSSSLWTVDDAMVVAVETGTFKGGTVVKGTRWWVVNKIICKNYPELDGPLSIITPHKRIIQE